MAIGIHCLFFTFVALGVFAEARVMYDCNANIVPRYSRYCGNVVSSGLNSIQIQEILDAFKANDYGSLTWSNELASEAQALTNACQSSNGQCYTDYNRISVITSNSNENLTQMINSLYQSKRFEFPTITMPTFTMPTFTMPNFEMPSLEMPTFTMPTFKMPTFKMPTFTMPTFTMPGFEMSIFGAPDESEYRRDSRSSVDYTNMIGCGFTIFENGGRVTKYFECFSGPIISV